MRALLLAYLVFARTTLFVNNFLISGSINNYSITHLLQLDILEMHALDPAFWELFFRIRQQGYRIGSP